MTAPIQTLTLGETKCYSIPNDSSDKQEGEENVVRGNWTGKFDFFLSSVGYAVGLGNIWRFPYLCYQNGGGAFLIPYTIMLAAAGLPVFFFEMSFGQFANLGPIGAWKISPLFKGIGYSMVTISILVSIYYNVIIAWSIRFMFASFTSTLPWMDCQNEWNDELCKRGKFNDTFENGTFIHQGKWYKACSAINNKTTKDCVEFQSPAEQYWERQILGVTTYEGVTRTLDDSLGMVKWDMALCLFLAWVIVCLCLINGVKSSGKVVYFTATFPYVVLIILLIVGILLPGSRDGITFYTKPNFSRLLEARPWGEAAVQIFYSLGVGFGGLCTMASYNKFKNNCYRDAILVAVINCGTSVFAGFAIFSLIGYMAYTTGQPVEKVVKSGVGLAFIAYPEGIATMPVPPLWSILFFGMLLTLGLDSQFGMVEAVFTGLIDEFPILGSCRRNKMCLIIGSCIAFYLLGLPMVCEGGIYIFTIFNDYSGSYSLMIVVICELLVVSYVYGIKSYLRDVQMMLGFKPNYYWIACWCGISPFIILAVFVFTCSGYAPSSYAGNSLPVWAQVLGWLMAVAGIIPIPILIIIQLYKNKFSKELLQPSIQWGPCVKKFWLEDPFYAEKLLQLELYENNRNEHIGESNQAFELEDRFIRF